MSTKKKQTTAIVATANENTDMVGYEGYEDEGAGFEDQTADDNAIPFIQVLQKTSKYCDENEEAVAGMFHNTVSDGLIDGKEGFIALCVYTRRVCIEWVPRDKGGGYRGEHELNSEIVRRAKAKDTENKFGPWDTDDGNHLVETVQGYFVQLNEDRIPGTAFMIGFAGTQHKPYKAINTQMSTYRHPVTVNGEKRYQRPPMWAHCLRITSEKQQNDKGTWFTYSLKPINGEIATSLIDPRSIAFEAGKALWTAIKSGEKYAAQPQQDGGAVAPDDDVPF